MIRALILLSWLAATIAAAAPAGTVAVRGHVVDATHQPLVGVTVIATGAGSDAVAISDDAGGFAVAVAAATTLKLTYYYEDTTVEQTVALAGSATEADVGAFTITVKPVPECGCCWGVAPPMIDIATAFAMDFTVAWPTLRSRDSAALGSLVAVAQPTTAVFDGSRRLTGAPGVALALLAEVDVYTMRGATTLDERADGTLLSPNGGTNENRGSARLDLGTDGAAVETGAGGPIAVDSAWWWAGAVLGPDGDQELARVDYAASFEELGSVVALRQVVPALAELAELPAFTSATASATATAVSDDWIDATWTSKLDDNKLAIAEGVSGERLDDGGTTTRGEVHARVTRRGRLAGYHELQLSGALGAGRFDTTDHRDAAAAAGDFWQLRPNLDVDVGVRWDERWFGADHAQVWQPHATLGWDWTKEGRSEVYVGADRASLLDATALGGWIAGPRWRDDAFVGVRYELVEPWLASLGARDSEIAGVRKTGVDAQLDHRGRRFELHFAATSVERAVAGYAGLRLDRAVDGDARSAGTSGITAGVSGRWAGDADDPWGSQLGATVAWRRRFKRGLATSLGGELVTDRRGELGRVVAGFSY